MVTIKGYEFNLPKVKDSHNRRAQNSKNNILISFRALGLTKDDVDIEISPVAFKNLPASVSWWINKQHLYYSCKRGNFAENLAIIAIIIDREIQQILQKKKTLQEFITDFEEDPDVEKERKKAREHLGVDEHATLDYIDEKYKQQAKKAHPDTSSGDTQTFKNLNHAHKILKRELE
jgi:hypothetical protein